ncbi:MAG: uncharacterized protein QOI47_483 [Actinomycetota bacterium]|nr:uncharacterized protein [Actinomycetota bacterium]
MAGAFNDPADGAVAFRADDRAAVESFAEHDPYLRNGPVTAWHVRRWVMVMGDGAEAPCAPAADRSARSRSRVPSLVG